RGRQAGETGRKTMSCLPLPTSHYAQCAGRELHYVEMGSPGCAAAGHVAWTGAYRPRLRRPGAGPGRPVPGHLLRHDRPRHVAMETRAGAGILPGFLRPAGERRARPAGPAAGPLDRHLDGRRDRPARCRHRAARTRDALGAQRYRPDASRAGRRTHPGVRRRTAVIRYGWRAGNVVASRLPSLWMAERRAMAPHGGNLDAPPARWTRHHALRPGHRRPIPPSPHRLRTLVRIRFAAHARIAAAWRRLRPAVAGRRARHDAARAARPAYRFSWLWPRPGAQRHGADPGRRRFSRGTRCARLTRIVVLTFPAGDRYRPGRQAFTAYGGSLSRRGQAPARPLQRGN